MKIRLFLMGIFFVVASAALNAQAIRSGLDQATTLLNQGKELMQQGKYQEALPVFRQVVLVPGPATSYGEAYFYLAKTLFVLARIDESARNFEYFIDNYADNSNLHEALYLRARILYLQSEFKNAVEAFAYFIEKFPKSIFVANGYYWTGEALYSLGQFDEARKMFLSVVQNFPNGARIEAARYRLSLIELRKRETQLLELVKWSHQENIKNLEDFQTREKTYEEAIRSYQRKLASLASEDFKDEITSLQKKLLDAETKIPAFDSRINDLNAQLRKSQSDAISMRQSYSLAQERLKALETQLQKPFAEAMLDLERQKRLLEAKEEALKLKEASLLQGNIP